MTERDLIERRIRSHTERLMKLTASFEDRTDAHGEAWRDLNDALNDRFVLDSENGSDLRFGPSIVPEQESARLGAIDG